MKIINIFLLSFSFFIFSEKVFAGSELTPERVMPVSVSDDCEDDVGKILSFHVKEKIRKSESMKLDLGESNYKMQVLITSIPLSDKKKEAFSAYTVVMNAIPSTNANPIHLAHTIGVCSSENVEFCADTVVSHINSISDKVLTAGQKIAVK